MLVYHINNVLILLWSFLFFGIKSGKYRETAQSQRLKKIAFLTLCFAQLFLISVLRRNIGFDYEMYNEGFYRMWYEGFSNMQYLDWEVGFVFLTKCILFVTRSPLVYMGIIAVLCLAPVAWFIYKYSKMVWLSVVLYVNLYFYYVSMNFLRQAIALSITLFAWQFIKKKKFVWYLLIILLASLFHSTALIMIPIYFIMKIKPSALLALFYCYALLFFFISSQGFLDLLTTVFHQEYQKSALITQGLSFVYSVLPIAMAILAMLMKDKLLQLSADSRYLVGMAMLSAFLMIIMSRHAILERLSYYSAIYFILLLPEIACSIKAKPVEKRVQRRYGHGVRTGLIWGMPKARFLCLAVVLLATGLYQVYGMMTGVHGVFPYITWL